MWPEQIYEETLFICTFPAYPETFAIKQLRGRKYKAKCLKYFYFLPNSHQTGPNHPLGGMQHVNVLALCLFSI